MGFTRQDLHNSIVASKHESRQHICIMENNDIWKHKPHAGIEMHKQATVGKGLLAGCLIG